jgi:hypothetical protein
MAALGMPVRSTEGGEEVRVRVEFRPALRTEVVLETLAGLAREGRTTRAGLPRNPLRAAVPP